MISGREATAAAKDETDLPFGQLDAADVAFLEETRRLLASDTTALTDMLPRVYDELRQLAGNYLRRERSDHTLQPTALVHEAYLRLVDQRSVDWNNRGQFLAIAARMMRRILVNHAVARQTAKRGGGSTHVSLDTALDVFDKQAVSAVEVNRALHELEALDARQANIAELRFFGGLTVAETADVLSISPATVKREWNVAKLWLEREMSGRS
ncbi:MAG TPA: ECF-type sigma factor [Chthoniobacterales bacterium]|nr:ECF-type sigma factor [Chthoniobacterales bacterium]